ncbi:MAG: hypothetical protein ACP5IK_00505 [Candidatus Micrarchaeia archaeon]|jgi:hypothetical protein
MLDSAIAASIAGIGMTFLLTTLLVLSHNSEIVAYENKSIVLFGWSQAVYANLSRLSAAGIDRLGSVCNGKMCFRLLPLSNAEPCSLQEVCRILSTPNASYELVFYYENSSLS